MQVVANIYVTTASQAYLRQVVHTVFNSTTNTTKILPTFVDSTYNRSSLHYVSSKPLELASLISSTVNLIYKSPPPPPASNPSPHPTLGLIDHISLLTIAEPKLAIQTFEALALELNPALEFEKYGLACSPPRNLHDVRRELGYFDEPIQSSSKPILIGIPTSFVTNYNIRVSFNSSSLFTSEEQEKFCKRLARMIRSRDSEKTIGVEVLTLPYGENCYELATNIHQVEMVTSPAQLMSIIEEEISEGDVLVMGYPIGVTEQILSQLQSQAKNPKEFIFPPLT